MHVLKRLGFKTAILSGGFTYFGNYLRRKYGFDYVYANELEIEDGKLTGRYLGDIVDGKRKAELLKLISQVENVDIAQTMAVGELRSTPSRRSRRRPASRSRRSDSTEFSISSAIRTRISTTSNSSSKNFAKPNLN